MSRRSLLLMGILTAALFVFTPPAAPLSCSDCITDQGSPCTWVHCQSNGECATCTYECPDDQTCQYNSCDPDSYPGCDN